jgi:small-conductance mechanosensitive channel
VEVLVPNSYFLEKNVVNWTLSDPHHRYDFIVGVAYGSPLEKVMELFQKALKEQPHVLESPASRVFFETFADNSLNFHFYYWLDVRTADTGQVGSDIRMRIDRLCRENNIEIAYPQRDIHLRTSTPIQVELLK